MFVVVVGALGVASGGRTVNDLLRRAFLSHIPVPRKTRVIVPEGNRTIGRGDNVRLEAYAEGIVPANGKLEVKFRSRRAQEFPLEQDKANRARFGRTIENVQDTFDYTVYLNDGQSQTFTVKAIPRPTVATVECEQEFPAYTKLQAVRRLIENRTASMTRLVSGLRSHTVSPPDESAKPSSASVKVSHCRGPICVFAGSMNLFVVGSSVNEQRPRLIVEFPLL